MRRMGKRIVRAADGAVRARGPRENGDRDLRMLPSAMMVWSVALASAVTPSRMVAFIVLGAGAAVTCMLVAELRAMTRDGDFASARRQLTLHAVVLCSAACCALLSAALHAQMLERDALTRAVARADGASQDGGRSPGASSAMASVPVRVDATVTVPAIASDRRGHDCRYDVRALAASVALGAAGGADGENGAAGARGERHAPSVVSPSHAKVRVYANGRGCAVMRGGTYRFDGALQAARYGAVPLWLSVDDPAEADDGRRPDDQSPMTLANPPPWHRIATLMRSRFQRVTERLSDQGRVLVPGLTLGVLGDDAAVGVDEAMSDDGSAAESVEPVDPKYAQAVEDRFRDAGIMHLMAVSGGHFMVAAALVRRLCARFLASRVVVGVALAVACAALSLMMQPSDSVLRACAMGMMAAVAGMRGRPSQTMPALCWTVIGALLVDPGLATSHGFALSSAAVAGLALHACVIEERLRRWCPRPIAAAAAMTIAAQIYTLPIQVLMEPRIALHAVLANVLVAPFVTCATVAGLASLLVAPVCEPLALCCALLASGCTWVMETVARLVSDLPLAVLPWAQGIGGVALLMVLEGTVAMAVRARGGRGLRRGSPGRIAPCGESMGCGGSVGYDESMGRGGNATHGSALPTPYERARRWWRDTWSMIG